MTSKSSQPLLVIVVNFTNNATLFTINGVPVGTNSALVKSHYDNWVFNSNSQPESINAFFRESSNGRFTWTRAGCVYLQLDAAYNYAGYTSVYGWNPTSDALCLSNIVRQVMSEWDTMGRRDYHRCVKCEVLFRWRTDLPNRVCAAGGLHAGSATNLVYGVTTTGAAAIMTEGATNLQRGGSQLWGGGATPPPKVVFRRRNPVSPAGLTL